MFYEYICEQYDPQPVGGVRVETEHCATKNPWLVAAKFLGLVAIVAVGFALLLPSIPLPLWQATVLVFGILLIYVGLAFFFRPEPNEDNMGWAGGLVDDPFHYSDDMNRTLFTLHMVLGPGRFVAETVLDVCGLCGLLKDTSADTDSAEPPSFEGEWGATPPRETPPRETPFGSQL